MPPSLSSSDRFLDHFLLHLFRELMGVQKVVERLEDKSKSNEISTLYWRSELQIENPKSLLDKEKGNSWPTLDDDAQHKLLFMDITLDLDRSKQKLAASLGFWLLVEKSFLYIKSSPLTLTQLAQHAQQSNIDLKSAPPKAMAGMFAQVLKDCLDQIEPTIDDNTIALNMYYQDLQSSGVLKLTIDSQSRADPLTFGPLYHEIVAHPPQLLPQENTTHLHELDEAFKQWIQPKSSSAQQTQQKRPAVNSQIHKFAPVKKRKLKKKNKGFVKKAT